MTVLKNDSVPHVVIIGGGFGGLYAAKVLAGAPVRVTLIDRRNFHLFQPLLYQVATGSLSPGDIASPIRAVFSRSKNIRVIEAEVIDLDADARKVILRDGEVPYDTLIIATGSSHSYFGRDDWEPYAPGLKTVEDALSIRRRVFSAFEIAERATDAAERAAWMRFVIVGGGPTGVELAGTLGELAHATLKHDFRHIDPTQSEIILLEGTERILLTFPASLSAAAGRALTRLGVTVRCNTLVTHMRDGEVTVRSGDALETIRAHTTLWAAGVKASALGQVLAQRVGAPLDRIGRVLVQSDLTVAAHPEIFVVGDLASLSQDGKPLPGVAPVAMQQGEYVAQVVKRRMKGQPIRPFRYLNKGLLAVIGRNAAVADFGFLRVSGIIAWYIWALVHILYLIEFDNKVLVMIQWIWDYFMRKRGARLITYDAPGAEK